MELPSAASCLTAVVRVQAPAVVVVVAAVVVAVAMENRHSGVAKRHKASGGKPPRNLHYRDRSQQSAGLQWNSRGRQVGGPRVCPIDLTHYTPARRWAVRGGAYCMPSSGNTARRTRADKRMTLPVVSTQPDWKRKTRHKPDLSSKVNGPTEPRAVLIE